MAPKGALYPLPKMDRECGRKHADNGKFTHGQADQRFIKYIHNCSLVGATPTEWSNIFKTFCWLFKMIHHSAPSLSCILLPTQCAHFGHGKFMLLIELLRQIFAKTWKKIEKRQYIYIFFFYTFLYITSILLTVQVIVFIFSFFQNHITIQDAMARGQTSHKVETNISGACLADCRICLSLNGEEVFH